MYRRKLIVDKKDTKWAPEHHLSKFEQSVVMTLMPFFFYFFGFIPLDFCSKNYCSSINHHVMAIIWEKVVSIFAGNLYLDRNYLITTVQIRNDFLPYLKIWKHGLSAFFECTHHFLKISWKRAISSMLSFFQRIRFQSLGR